MENNKIKLGGFPPILYDNNNVKKKREFKNKINVIISNIIPDLNILNIDNILKINKT